MYIYNYDHNKIELVLLSLLFDLLRILSHLSKWRENYDFGIESYLSKLVKKEKIILFIVFQIYELKRRWYFMKLSFRLNLRNCGLNSWREIEVYFSIYKLLGSKVKTRITYGHNKFVWLFSKQYMDYCSTCFQLPLDIMVMIIWF